MYTLQCSANEVSPLSALCVVLCAFAGTPFSFHENRPSAEAPRVARMQQCFETIYLTAFFADSPMRQKISMWASHAAFIACGWCILQGGHPVNKNGTMGKGMYPRGYAYPVPHTMRLSGQSLSVGDPQLQVR